MKEYLVVNDSSLTNLVQSVNRYLQSGWDICEGIAVVRDRSGDYYYQAISRDLSDERSEAV
jgi:hypothetical protein